MRAPAFLSVLPTVPTLETFADSLYKCQYAQFFRALATVEEKHLLPSRLLSVHARYYVREMRIKAYSQLLESYRSVTMKNLSASFGMSQGFIDASVVTYYSFDLSSLENTGTCLASSRQAGSTARSTASTASSRRTGQTRRTRGTRRSSSKATSSSPASNG